MRKSRVWVWPSGVLKIFLERRQLLVNCFRTIELPNQLKVTLLSLFATCRASKARDARAEWCS